MSTTTHDSTIELNPITHHNETTTTTNNSPDHEHNQYTDQNGPSFSLPPADRGSAAWLVVIGGFIVEALLWGFAFTFGLFQEYYTSLPEFAGQESSIASIGTAATGLMYLGAPVALTFCRQYPHLRRQAMALGTVIMTVAFISASFAGSVAGLIATQGVLYAIGGSMIYYPVFVFIDEWFIVRKGLALGIMWASSGFGGLTVPYLVSWSLEKYGFRTALRIWAVVNVVLITPALLYLKPRLPISMVVRVNRPKIGFAIRPVFLAFQIGSVIEGVGYFLPGIYLPSYVRSLGMSGTVATTSIALLNVGTTLGCVVVGYLVDRWRVRNVIGLLTAGATFAVALGWGLGNSSAVVLIFSLLYGFFAGSYTTTWPGVVKEVLRKDQTAEANTIFCLLVAGRGLGNIICGPISQSLVHGKGLTQDFGYGYGSLYGTLIVFAASTSLLGGLGPMCQWIGVI